MPTGTSSPPELDMRVSVAGVPLDNPIMPASGTYDWKPDDGHPLDPDELGAVVTKSITLGSRRLAAGTLALARRHGFAAFTYAECHMGCGFGHCKSCAVPTRSGGYLLACLEGPVVDLGEVSDAYWHVLPA